jgi:hypothetical protein
LTILKEIRPNYSKFGLKLKNCQNFVNVEKQAQNSLLNFYIIKIEMQFSKTIVLDSAVYFEKKQQQNGRW